MARRARMPAKDGEKPGDKVATKTKGGAGKSQTVKRALSEIPDSEIKHYAELLLDAQGDLEETMKTAAGNRGVIRGVLDSAKKVGIPKEYLTSFTKTMKREPEDVRQELEFVDRAARILGRDRFVHQMDLFRDIHASPVKRPQDEGYRAGKSNGSAAENPYQPGTEENQQWSLGWNEGQAEIVRGMAPKNSKAKGEPTAEEAIAAGKAAAQRGEKITDCPYGKAPAKANWQSGWRLGHTDRALQGGGGDDGDPLGDGDAVTSLHEGDAGVEATAH